MIASLLPCYGFFCFYFHLLNLFLLSVRFCEILARNYAPGAAAPGTAAPEAAAPGAWIIWGNILSSIYAPGALFECTLLQEHI